MSKLHWCICLKSSAMQSKIILKKQAGFGENISKILDCKENQIKENQFLECEEDKITENKILECNDKERYNMNSQGIIQRLNTCIMALNKSNTELKTLGLKKAQTERNYKVKQAEEILKLRTEKYPATLIMELVKGNKEVAELRLQRDVSENAYFVCLDGIDNLRLEIELIKNKLKWIRTELNSW